MENQNETQQPKENLFAHVMSFLVLILLSYTVYLYVSYDFVKKGDLDKKYIKKNEVNFYRLSEDEQNKYISKSTYDFEMKQLNDKLMETKTTNCEPKIVEKIVEKEVPIIKTEYKTIYKDNIIEQTIDDKKALKYTDVFKCYDMGAGIFYQSKNSIKQLHKFLDKNKDAKYFEVIGIVDSIEFKLLKKLDKDVDAIKLHLVKDFVQIGLARQRVIGGTWNIKSYLGNDTDVRVVNYTITSKKGYKGFVVRAYK